MFLPDPLTTATPERIGGARVFAGTRIPIRILFEFIEDGAPLDEFLTSYPDITREHAVAVLELAKCSAPRPTGYSTWPPRSRAAPSP
jgi:uncharacterized protein (DUF433 family)